MALVVVAIDAIHEALRRQKERARGIIPFHSRPQHACNNENTYKRKPNSWISRVDLRWLVMLMSMTGA